MPERTPGSVLERRGDIWISVLLGPADVLVRPSIDIEIPIAELYEGLDFATRAGAGAAMRV